MAARSDCAEKLVFKMVVSVLMDSWVGILRSRRTQPVPEATEPEL